MTTSAAAAILLGVFTLSLAAYAADPSPPAPAAPAPASEKQVVLTVLGRAYTSAELDPELEIKTVLEDAQRRGADRGRVIYTSDRLNAILVRPLIERYIADHNITPTEGEVSAAAQAFRAATRALQGQVLQLSRERVEAIKKKLESPDLADADRERLRAQLQGEETAMEDISRRAQPDAPLDPMEREIARGFLTQWRFFRSLYDRFGGRVLVQQFGPEPFDAMREWLEDEERAGAFTFGHDGLRELLYHYYKADHGAWLVGGAEAKDSMSAPWWERKPNGVGAAADRPAPNP